jgi:hypothetical protein
MLPRYEHALARAWADMFTTGQHTFVAAPGVEATFAAIFETEMDRLTHQLEREGFRIWFDCEVDGVEYRLAARR